MADDITPLVRRAYEAFNRRDLVGFLALCEPDVAFTASFEGVELGGYEGAEGMRRWWYDTDEAFREIELAIESVEPHAGLALVHGRGHGLGRASGGQVTWPVALVIRVRDGRIASWELFQTPADAARAAGLADRGSPGRA